MFIFTNSYEQLHLKVTLRFHRWATSKRRNTNSVRVCVSLVPLQWRVTSNRYKAVLSFHVYPVIKHFSCNRSFQDCQCPQCLGEKQATKWFDEYKNMNHVFLTSMGDFTKLLAFSPPRGYLGEWRSSRERLKNWNSCQILLSWTYCFELLNTFLNKIKYLAS